MEEKKMVTSTYMDNKPDYVPHINAGGAGKATGGGHQGGTSGGAKQMDSDYFQVDKKRTDGHQKQSPFGAGPTQAKTPQTGAHTSIGGGMTTMGGKQIESGYYHSAMKKIEGPKKDGPVAWFGVAPPDKATPTSNQPTVGGNQKNMASNYMVKDMNKSNQVGASRSQAAQSQDQAQASGGVKVAANPIDSPVATLPKGLEPSVQSKGPKTKTKTRTKKSKRLGESYSKDKRVSETTEESSSEESVDLDSDGTLMDIHSQVLDAPLSDHRWMKWDMDGAAFAPKDQLAKTSSSTTGSTTGSTATSTSSTNLAPPKATSTTGTTSTRTTSSGVTSSGVQTKPRQEETTKMSQNSLVNSEVDKSSFETLRTDYGDTKKAPGVAGKEKKTLEETRKKEQALKKAAEAQKKKLETKSTPNTHKVVTPTSALRPKSDPDKGARPSPSKELLITQHSAATNAPSAQVPLGRAPVAGYDVAALLLKHKVNKGIVSPGPSPSAKEKGHSPISKIKAPSVPYPYQVIKKSDVPAKDSPKP